MKKIAFVLILGVLVSPIYASAYSMSSGSRSYSAPMRSYSAPRTYRAPVRSYSAPVSRPTVTPSAKTYTVPTRTYTAPKTQGQLFSGVPVRTVTANTYHRATSFSQTNWNPFSGNFWLWYWIFFSHNGSSNSKQTNATTTN